MDLSSHVRSDKSLRDKAVKERRLKLSLALKTKTWTVLYICEILWLKTTILYNVALL